MIDGNGKIRLKLSDYDLAPAKEAARGRQGYALSIALPEYGTNNSPDEQLRKHEIGCIGEYLVSLYFGLPFDPTVGQTTEVDLKIIEVRTAWRKSGINLPVRPHDKPRLPFFLAILDEIYCELVGWLTGWEARQRVEESNLPFIKGAWYCPPPYHSILSLQQWIASGHRLHWCPEKYR